MGVLHFFCCADDFPPHSPVRYYDLHPDDHHHHHHHHGHGHDHGNHHHHRHVHDLRLRVHSLTHNCPNHRGIGITPGFGLRNSDLEHHVNDNGGEDWGVGQMGNVASHQSLPGQNKNFEAKPNGNTRRENHVRWDDLNEMTSQLNDGPSTAKGGKKDGNNGKGVNHNNAGYGHGHGHYQSGCVEATHDEEVVSYNITVHKHVKGGSSSGSGHTKVIKNDIHFDL